MEYVLSIDVSQEPACAVVAQIDGKSVKVVEQVFAPVGSLFSRESLLQSPTPPEATVESSEATATASSNGDSAAAALLPFKNLISQVSTPWLTAVIIVPPHDYLSLNVTLPLSDSKSIDKVIDLEVQDLVPFDVKEFFVDHSSVAARNGAGTEIHVGLYPRRALVEILRLCAQSNVEPSVVSTPSGVLSSLLLIAPDYIVPNSALVFADDRGYHLAFVSDGKVVADRAIERAPIQSETSMSESGRELKVSLASLESEYGTRAEKVYLLGNGLSAAELQQSLGRTIERVSGKDIFSEDDDRSLLASLGAACAIDLEHSPPLLNLRSREFAYHAYVKELGRAARKLFPLGFVTLATCLISIFAIYLNRQSTIRSIRGDLKREIVKVLPGVEITEGQELLALNGQINEIEKQLKGLGSFSRHSPLK